MKWSLKLGKFAGIDVFVHATFFMLLGWVALMHWQREQSASAALGGALFIIAIFICVVLHEYGHALMARRYGIATRDIILLPIGGVARLERMPTQPVQELWVALAGPAVNVVIVAVLYGWLKLTAAWEPVQSLTVTTGPFLERLMAANIVMIVFNMIPAFPLDGGRVLRALMATRMAYNRATQRAAVIGRGLAILFGALGFLYNPFLILIAIFIYVGAGQEAELAEIKTAVGDVPVSRAMVSDFKTLSARDSLNRAVELTLAGTQKDFPVVNNGMLAGVLRQTDLFRALSERDARTSSVASVESGKLVIVEATDPLDSVVAKFSECDCQTLPVTRGGELVGLLTTDNLSKFMRIQAVVPN